MIKWKGTGEGPLANAIDWISLRLARAVGIPVPTPYLIDIRPDFVQQTRDGEIKDIILRSLGLNLGIEFIEGAALYHQRDANRIPSRMKDLIYTFDVLFLNIDRTDMNPNMIVAGERLFCIDMAAVQAVKALLSGQHTSEQTLLPLLRRHPFYSKTPKITLPTSAGLEGIVESVPREWLPDGSRHVETLYSGISKILSDSRAILDRRLTTLNGIPLESLESIRERALRNRRAFEEKTGRPL